MTLKSEAPGGKEVFRRSFLINNSPMNFKNFSFLVLLACLLTQTANALDVELRRWGHLPIDTHFMGLAYAHVDADINFNPALELEDVEMDLDIWAAKYIYSFESFGKSSRIDITQTYQEGHWEGLLQGAPAQTSRHGLGDTFVRYAINLYGAPPLKSDDYFAYRRAQENETIVGAGVAVRLPTGDYDKDRLINLGQNRFVIRPQLGVQHNRGPWTFEVNSEIAFYETNTDFFGGKSLQQDPVFILLSTVSYTFRPGLWAGVGAAYDYGGENEVNGVSKDNRGENVAWGALIAYPLSRRIGISLTYIENRTQESTGLDSESLAFGVAFSF
jgi:hypothetical protein